MSDRFKRALHKQALAAATVAVLSCITISAASAGDRINLAAQANQSLQDELLIKYRSGSKALKNGVLVQGLLNTASRSFSGNRTALELKHLRRISVGADLVRVNRKLNEAELNALMREIRADSNVEYVVRNTHMQALFTPNDTSFGQQWGYTDADAGIDATQAWDISTGTGVVVAVIDSGIASHSDLNANIIGGYDFVVDTTVAGDGDGRDASPADPGSWCTSNGQNSNWHGTHVAGTVAAVSNNGKGVAGTAFNAKVVPARALGRCGGQLSDVADAVTWASGGSVAGVPANPNPAEVINMSLGGGGTCDPVMQAAIDGAVQRGVTVVVAAGNNNGNAANITPANCANIITVGAVDSAGARSVWSSAEKSNYGAVVDVAAPGSNVLSTINTGTTTPVAESYGSYGGTSMATPHVAGVVALIQAKATTPKTPAEIEALLKSTVKPFPRTPDQPIGVGIVNAKAALDGLGGGGTTPTPGVQTYTNGTDVAIPDNNTTGVSSSIVVSGRSGNAPSNAEVSVNIVHPYQGDLIVDVIAPDGSAYNLHNQAGAGADNIVKTYTVNLSSETLNGTWKLRVSDRGRLDVGKIDSWSIKF